MKRSIILLFCSIVLLSGCADDGREVAKTTINPTPEDEAIAVADEIAAQYKAEREAGQSETQSQDIQTEEPAQNEPSSASPSVTIAPGDTPSVTVSPSPSESVDELEALKKIMENV